MGPCPKRLAFRGRVWLGGIVAATTAGACVVAGCLLVVVSCSGEQSERSAAGGSSEPSTSTARSAVDTTSIATTTTDPTDASFHWTSEGDRQLETGSLVVPLDYDDPEGATITLAVARHRASDPDLRVGSLLVNPGGPGFGGSVLAEEASLIYGPELLKRFDIIGWDPRGTGESMPAIDCVDSYDPYFGIETGPNTAAEDVELRARVRRVRGGLRRAVGSAAGARHDRRGGRDMDAIRARSGRRRSPTSASVTARGSARRGRRCSPAASAAVLDGALDPTLNHTQFLIDQAAGFDRTLTAFLDDCSARQACPFNNGGDSAGAFTALVAQLEANPVATKPGRPPLLDGVFELGVAQALYREQSWTQLARALAAAQRGDGALVLDLYDLYYGRHPDGGYGDELEAYFAIMCSDDPGTPDLDAAIAQRPNFEAVSPIGHSAAAELVVCTSLPRFGGQRFEVTGAGAGPIMVVGSTGDPATPYEGSRRMAETLEEGFFVGVDSYTHGSYRLNNCIDEAIEDYLVDLTVPDAELSC